MSVPPGPAPAPAGPAPKGRLMFVTSNGTGLGHLTRSMAIARRLDASLEPLFVTFSAAAPVVREQGFPVEYLASYDRPGAGNDLRWTRRTRARLRALVEEADPAAVVFDGANPYRRLLSALRSTGAPLVWCRRAMWRADSDPDALGRSEQFDAILEPGELAAEVDRGPTARRRAETTVVDPIVLLDGGDLLPRAGAERELGLEPGRTNVLVQLGQGEGVGRAAERTLRHLAGRDGVQVAAVQSSLAELAEAPPGVVRIERTYPVSRHLAAFDAAISAAGYNAFHELLALGPPALFVPISRLTDDQAARAGYAAEQGLGLAVEGPGDPALESRLDELLDPSRRGEIRERLEASRPPNGATAAARFLADVARTSRAGPGAAGAAASRWSPRVAAAVRGAANLIGQTITRPAARVVVLALGTTQEGLDGTLARIDAPPERILVVTDRLDFAPLLAAGVGFEHIPGPGERQAELAGVPYEEFRRRRLAMILAERPRRRRVVPVA